MVFAMMQRCCLGLMTGVGRSWRRSIELLAEESSRGSDFKWVRIVIALVNVLHVSVGLTDYIVYD